MSAPVLRSPPGAIIAEMNRTRLILVDIILAYLAAIDRISVVYAVHLVPEAAHHT
jgi:hypothetical protein